MTSEGQQSGCFLTDTKPHCDLPSQRWHRTIRCWCCNLPYIMDATLSSLGRQMGEEGTMGNQDRDKTPTEDHLGARRTATAIRLY